MKNVTLYCGKNIAQSNSEVLTPVSAVHIHQFLLHTPEEIRSQIRQLEQMLDMDRNAAETIKRKLPFFTGATFRYGIRRLEHFESIAAFVLDFDQLPLSDDFINQTVTKLKADPQVYLLFTSPSGRGLKAVFVFENQVNNSMKFTQFYKSFAVEFASRHGLEEFIDTTTCDVSRVCFLSYDPGAYLNENAKRVAFIDLSPVPSLINREEGEVKVEKQTLSDEVYREIVKTLDPSSFVRPARQIFVPAELMLIYPVIEQAMTEHGFVIKETKDIHYGRKYIITHGLNLADVNVYYGKNGFQVVRTPKRGTNPIFAEAVSRIMLHAIYKHWTTAPTPRY